MTEFNQRVSAVSRLVIESGETMKVTNRGRVVLRLVPDPQTKLREGQEILFAGGWDVPDRMSLVSSYCTTLAYVMTGEQLASGHLWRWLTGVGDQQRC